MEARGQGDLVPRLDARAGSSIRIVEDRRRGQVLPPRRAPMPGDRVTGSGLPWMRRILAERSAGEPGGPSRSPRRFGLLLSMGMAGHCEPGAPAKRAGAGGGIETRSGLEPAPTAVLLGTRG